MRTIALARWDPFQDVVSLRDAMDRLFAQSVVRPTPLGVGTALPLDVYTQGDNYVIEVPLPGINPDAVDISILGNQVSISGEYETQRESPTEGQQQGQAEGQQQGQQGRRQYLVREMGRGRFERMLTLPTELNADQATAHYENGVLRLTVPKAESSRPRRIAISGGSPQRTESAGSTQG